MNKIIIVNGMIAGVIVSAFMIASHRLVENEMMGYDFSVLIGYASMVLAFSMIFVGIRTYRDRIRSGIISFGQAFKVGILITLVASFIYAAAWEIYYRTSASGSTERYTEQYLQKMEAEGATTEEVSSMRQEMKAFNDMYQNALVRFGITLMEILPVGLAVTLLSAALMSSRKREGPKTRGT